jgi:hypothetical protein
VVSNVKDLRQPLVRERLLPIQHAPEELYSLPRRFTRVYHGDLILRI